ncbi:proline racemase [Trichosporon asahii var. asahii CBS 8904]|uniref:trans-L-3-hydroxyproline dehydratase n=1 Tax=Trichosporon asahii var. asahii (strain CBS 8904) TaxID=1220162 RepID=K1VMV7_TRIAC|nr:proline racemase [Trichosporon asahii var. asahii CBS 8904]
MTTSSSSSKSFEPYWLQAEDWHTAGEPFRIVRPPASMLPESIPSVADFRHQVASQGNHPLNTLRKTLCLEPRGHADMYGCFLLPANEGAHFGVLFWHKDGFSTACGHGTIALGSWAVHHHIVEPKEGLNEVIIDVPSGRVKADVHMKDGKVEYTDFVSVPSYVLKRDVSVLDTKVDLAFAGAVYATMPSPLVVRPENHEALISFARQIKASLAPNDMRIYGDYDLYGVIFYEDLPPNSRAEAKGVGDAVRQRNVTIFADGELDRSPCGSGTAARVASLLAEGKMKEGSVLIHESIVGTTFRATIDKPAESPTDFPGCVARVRGRANLVAKSEFYIDPEDPVYPGFCFSNDA